MTVTRIMCCLPGVCGALFACAASAADLPLGETVAGRVKEGRAAVYDFAAPEAGVLLVVVRGSADVLIKVVDSSGRPVEGGAIDMDFGGDAGAEQGAIVLGTPGEYQVRIEPFFGDAEFTLAASWLAVPAVARDPDPHGSPDDAIAFESGKSYEEVIAQGDREDWYRFEAKADGLLNVATRSEDGDMVLDCFADGTFDTAVAHSDDDIGGDTGRESVTIDVTAGDVYYFVVSSLSNEAGYSIRGVLTDN